MSGPKVDTAEIRRQELSKLSAARAERINLVERIQKMINRVNACMGSDAELMMQDESLRSGCEHILETQEVCIKELHRLLNTVKLGNEMLNIDEIQTRAQHIVAKFDQETQSEVALVKQHAKASQKFRELEANRQQLEQAKREKIVRLTNTDTEAEVTEGDVEELIETFKGEFTDFMESTHMISKQKKSMLLIHQDLQELIESGIPADKKEKRIKRLFSDFQKLTSLIKTEAAEMEYMYEEYVRECFDSSVPPLQMSDFDSKKDIEEAIETAKEDAVTNVSREYIKRQIDEVMAKHGYDVIKSDMLVEANQSGQVLYGVDKDTAIDVFVSNEDQVTMRVVGIGFDSEISDAEGERLFQQQCAFCSMHPKITAELAMRGVILHTKKHMPPDKKFNKKIQTRSKSDNQTTSRAKKELKKTELKTMHKE